MSLDKAYLAKYALFKLIYDADFKVDGVKSKKSHVQKVSLFFKNEPIFSQTFEFLGQLNHAEHVSDIG